MLRQVGLRKNPNMGSIIYGKPQTDRQQSWGRALVEGELRGLAATSLGMWVPNVS